MLNKKFIRKWIDALRSGDYKQGRGALCSDKNKYCCLGVACELLPKKFKGIWIEDKEDNSWNLTINGDEDAHFGGDLPNEILNYIGINCYIQNDLINLNDLNKLSFKQIAKYIETQILNPNLK